MVEGGADVEIGSEAGPIRVTQTSQVIEPQSPYGAQERQAISDLEPESVM